MQILLLNGPNLNLLGVREPEVYGKETFTDYFRQLKNKYPSVDISCFQSNVEGELIDKIHEVGFSYDGIILNIKFLLFYYICSKSQIHNFECRCLYPYFDRFSRCDCCG